MAPPTDVQLHDMGLSPKDHADEAPSWSQWDRKADLHAAIIASDQPNKPTGDLLWKSVRDATATGTTSCNMCIHIARLTGIVIGGNEDGTDKVLEEQFYICKKEAAVWVKQYLSFSDGDSKSTQHLKQASGKENYSIPTYNTYVPIQVRAASDEYITKYYNKHKGTNQRLT